MTTNKGRRINARLTPELARKVAYLCDRTRKSTTDIVRESIEQYYVTVSARGETPLRIFARAGLIGCAEGPSTLSRRYKAELVASLGKKA